MEQYIVIISFLITQAQKTIMISLIFENIETKLILNTGYEMLDCGKVWEAIWRFGDCSCFVTWGRLLFKGNNAKKKGSKRAEGGGAGVQSSQKTVKGVKGVTKNFALTFGIDGIYNNANILPECKN